MMFLKLQKKRVANSGPTWAWEGTCFVRCCSDRKSISSTSSPMTNPAAKNHCGDIPSLCAIGLRESRQRASDPEQSNSNLWVILQCWGSSAVLLRLVQAGGTGQSPDISVTAEVIWGESSGSPAPSSQCRQQPLLLTALTLLAQDKGKWAETLTVSSQTLPRVTKINLFIPPHWRNIKLLLSLTSLSHPVGREFVSSTVKIIY